MKNALNYSKVLFEYDLTLTLRTCQTELSRRLDKIITNQ